MQTLLHPLQAFLSNPWALGIWAAAAGFCVLLLVRDLRLRNPEIMGLMRLVWILTVAYPVNVLLIRFGVKEGMHSPKEMAH